MLDLRAPWQPVAMPATRPLWQSLALVLRSAMPYSLDPTADLHAPSRDASYTTERVSIPVGNGSMPGWLFEPRRPAGPSVILVHGTMAFENSAYFYFIREILAVNFRVLTIELDGHGENTRPLCLPGLDEDVPAAVAFLRGRDHVDPKRIGLIGVSLGGACCLNAAAADPGIRAVITVATPHRLQSNEWASLAEVFGMMNPEMLPILFKATPDHMLRFMTTPMRVAEAPDQTASVCTFLDEEISPTVNRCLRFLNPLDSAQNLGDTPLLVINGEWDNVAPPWQALDIYERAKGPKALAMVPRRNHMTVMFSKQAADATTHWFRRWL